jgi:hypothetical protein
MHRPTHSIGFPLSGEWVAVNTPAERIPSHGTDFFGQSYAFDFVRLNAKGTGFSSRSVFRQFAFFVHASDFLAWNEPVFAAFNGKVVAAEDGWPDRMIINALWQVIRATFIQGRPEPSDLRSLLGNYLLIEGEPGVALYAHLRKGTVLAQLGQLVQGGQRLGSVGNSGNSTMPHLHFHVMDRANPWEAEGVYCDFTTGEPEAVPIVPPLMKPFRARPLRTGDA